MDFQTALTNWLNKAQVIVNKNYERFQYVNAPTLTLQEGSKNIKVVEINDDGGKSVFCFIEKATGNVLKAASWKAPAKHARGNIFIEGKEGVTAYGAHYLI